MLSPKMYLLLKQEKSSPKIVCQITIISLTTKSANSRFQQHRELEIIWELQYPVMLHNEGVGTILLLSLTKRSLSTSRIFCMANSLCKCINSAHLSVCIIKPFLNIKKGSRHLMISEIFFCSQQQQQLLWPSIIFAALL